MKKYEVVIEDIKTGDVNLIENIKSLKKARLTAMMYQKDYRVMINEVNKEYGTCKNIYDNISVFELIDDIEKEMEEITNI